MRAGSDINKILPHGGTMLHEFIEMNAIPQVTILLTQGARYNIKNSQGQTAYELALYSGSPAMLERMAHVIGTRRTSIRGLVG